MTEFRFTGNSCFGHCLAMYFNSFSWFGFNSRETVPHDQEQKIVYLGTPVYLTDIEVKNLANQDPNCCITPCTSACCAKTCAASLICLCFPAVCYLSLCGYSTVHKPRSGKLYVTAYAPNSFNNYGKIKEYSYWSHPLEVSYEEACNIACCASPSSDLGHHHDNGPCSDECREIVGSVDGYVSSDLSCLPTLLFERKYQEKFFYDGKIGINSSILESEREKVFLILQKQTHLPNDLLKITISLREEDSEYSCQSKK